MPPTRIKDWLTDARELGLFNRNALSIANGSIVGLAAENDCIGIGEVLAIRDLLEAADNDDDDLCLLLAMAFCELDKGSVCLRISKETLAPLATQLCGARRDDLVGCIVDELKVLRMGKGRWRSLIGVSKDEFKPLILIESGGIEHLYFQRNLVNSLMLKDRLENLCRAPLAPLAEEARLQGALTNVFDLQRHPLNHRQRLAVATAALQRFTIVSGGPGTGKTSIVVALLQCMLRCGMSLDDVQAVAPTGRAAQRMSESIRRLLPAIVSETDEPLLEMTCRTLHSLLGYTPSQQGYLHSAEYPLRLKAVIVDEVSMVDVEVMAALLAALPDDARVIFLGDKDQLPSVEAGAILAELIPSETTFSLSAEFSERLQALVGESASAMPVANADNPMNDRVIVLDTSYRSERSILTLAALINTGDAATMGAMEKLSLQKRGLPFADIGHGVFHCDCSTSSADRLRAVLDSWAVDHYLASSDCDWLELLTQAAGTNLADLSSPDNDLTSVLDDLFIHLASAQILTLTRHGVSGVDGINTYMTSRLKPVCDPDGQERYFHGQPILVQRNDRTWGLFNGDVGIVLRGRDGHYRAVFKRMNAYVSLALDVLPATAPAFALTVHKSQGSEYGRVVFIMPPKEDSPLLCREILYTGVTRAKNAVIMIGSTKVIRAAVIRRNHRDGGIRFWGDETKLPAHAPSSFDDLPLFG